MFENSLNIVNAISRLSKGSSKCRLTGNSVYPLEKALVFQDLMRNFTVNDYSVGYEIYSGFAFY